MSGMALANLMLNVQVNAGGSAQALQSVQRSAHDSMSASEASVEAFRQSMIKAAADMNSAADRIGSSMQAANDAVMSSATASEQAMQQMGKASEDAAKAVESSQSRSQQAWERVKDGVKTKLGEAYDWTVSTVEKMAAVWAAAKWGGALAGATAAVLTNIYVAYKAASFAVGLVTGSSYKSENIDALVEANNRVIALQEAFRVSAQSGSVLDDVFQRLGVNGDKIVATYSLAEAAMRLNTEELDRLGVRYKDSNGQLLSQHDALVNAKAVLDQYSDGWDRQQAAAAIGMGSYKQITEALQVTNDEIDASSSRLDDYQLKIGPASQAAVAVYQDAMRKFANESRLTSEGFKRAIADTIMPTLTDLANFFKDGFPFAVRAFRGSLATVASMLYGVKLVADMVVDAFKGAFTAGGDLFAGLGAAAEKAMSGDFQGAAQAMQSAWAKAGTGVGHTFDEMVADATKARDRMAMAWGVDDRADGPIARVNDLGKRGKGKSFVAKPKPEADKGGSTSERSPYQNYLNELDQRTKKLQENEYASMRLKAEQLAEKEGIRDLAGAYAKINAIQGQESTKSVQAYAEKLRESRSEQSFQLEIMDKGAKAQEILTAQRQIGLDVERQILQAQQSGKPLTDDAIAKMLDLASAQKKVTEAAIEKRYALERSPEFALAKASREYIDEARNSGKQSADFFNRTMGGIEDTMTAFFSGQQVNVRGFISSILAEYTRLTVVKPLLASLTGSSGGKSAISSLGDAMGSAGSTDWLSTGIKLMAGLPSFANGLSYVPFDGFAATLHEGERIQTRQEAAAGRNGGGVTVVNSGATNIGQGVSRGEVAAGIAQAQRAQEMRMRRLNYLGVMA